MTADQTGYFEIDHTDLDGSTVLVPKDVAGQSPEGNDNDPNNELTAYDLEGGDKDSKGATIYVVNDLNENVDAVPKGSHLFDEDLAEAVEDGTAQTVNSGGDKHAFDVNTDHSYIGLEVSPAVDPTSGKLKVIIQERSA